RLAMLSRDEKEVLRAAAELGCEFRNASLGEACGGSTAADWPAAVRAAEKLGFLRQGRAVGWHSFAQTMVRERLLELDFGCEDVGVAASVAHLPHAETPSGKTIVIATTDSAAFRKEGEF